MSDEPLYCYKSGVGWVPVAQDPHTYYKDVNGKVWRLEERVPCPKPGEPWTAVMEHESLQQRLQLWTDVKLTPSDDLGWHGDARLIYTHYYAFVPV